ncbi:MAG: LacI family transcriptional regulator [Oscillibacter sp.]|nr:LacI family transcriptional regulator [Oscillibacter sp.]
MATIKDVAKMAGVSPSTVSRTLSGKIPVDSETRERVMNCVRQLDYRPNVIAKGLREGKTRAIAFLLPNIENQIYPSLAIAVEAEARRHGYFVFFCNTQDDPQRELDYVEKLKSRFVDGFIFSTAASDSPTILQLRRQEYPVVCLMRATADGVNAFVSNNEQGAYLGVSFLIENGFTRIATITGRPSLELYKQRLQGYCRALEDHGLPLDPALIWSGVDGQCEKAFHCTREHLLAGPPPEVIFAQSDPLAFDAMRAAGSLGLRVPEDLSVLGYDNVPLAACYTPPLTTVEQPLHEMGKAAVQRLISMIEGDIPLESPATQFSANIIIRGSVKLAGQKTIREFTS